MKKYKVGVLGATGAVGQRFIQLLENHPWFEINHLFASERSASKTYADAVEWRLPTPMPEAVKSIVVKPCEPQGVETDLVFSALPSGSAREVEPAFAKAGFPVVSNASAWRMGEDIPLVIPEVNPEHTALIDTQQASRSWRGYIVTNPNCSTMGLVPPLKALDLAFGLKKAFVATMQATSGAGYPGPPIEVIGDNVLPLIKGEEDKIETEPKKLLGQVGDGVIDMHPVLVSAQAHRVHVSDGHLEAVSLELEGSPSIDEVKKALNSFEGLPQKEKLPFAPERAIVVAEDEDRPQPKLDRDAGNGMTVTVGRVRTCPLLGYKMVILSHNTVRGAAGAAILNAELLVHQGRI